NHARDSRMQNARGDEPQDELRAVDVDGVPGVMTALKSRHDREVRRQQIDDLALAFVAPLRAENDEIQQSSVLSHSRQSKSSVAVFSQSSVAVFRRSLLSRIRCIRTKILLSNTSRPWLTT